MVVGADGVLTVTAAMSLSPEAWGTLDALRLVRSGATDVDPSALEARVADAAAIDRALYTPASLAALDAAVEIARVVLAADWPTQDAVDRADALVEAALAGLDEPGEEPDGATRAPAVATLSHDNGKGRREGRRRRRLRRADEALIGAERDDVPPVRGRRADRRRSADVWRHRPAVGRGPVSGKSNGTYVYTGELVNSQGVTATKQVKVKVKVKK